MSKWALAHPRSEYQVTGVLPQLLGFGFGFGFGLGLGFGFGLGSANLQARLLDRECLLELSHSGGEAGALRRRRLLGFALALDLRLQLALPLVVGGGQLARLS